MEIPFRRFVPEHASAMPERGEGHVLVALGRLVIERLDRIDRIRFDVLPVMPRWHDAIFCFVMVDLDGFRVEFEEVDHRRAEQSKIFARETLV
jgi:hypothetical protein